MQTSRIQLALNVDDVDEATAFYERLFATPAHKRREGYANFVIADPPMKLVLIENPGAGGGLNHLGVEAATADDVGQALHRFRTAGLDATVAEQDVCCHAVQDKVFVAAPDVPLGWWEFGRGGGGVRGGGDAERVHGPGNEPWEVYTVAE